MLDQLCVQVANDVSEIPFSWLVRRGVLAAAAARMFITRWLSVRKVFWCPSLVRFKLIVAAKTPETTASPSLGWGACLRLLS